MSFTQSLLFHEKHEEIIQELSERVDGDCKQRYGYCLFGAMDQESRENICRLIIRIVKLYKEGKLTDIDSIINDHPEVIIQIYDVLGWGDVDIYWEAYINSAWNAAVSAKLLDILTLSPDRAKYFLDRTPPALREEEWLLFSLENLSRESHELFSCKRKLKLWIGCLEKFTCWDRESAKIYIETIDIKSECFSAKIFENILLHSEQINALDRAYLTLICIWKYNQELSVEDMKGLINDREESEILSWLMDRVKELPGKDNNDAIYMEFGEREKIEWRKEIQENLAHLPLIRHGFIEFILENIQKNHYRLDLYSDMEILIIILCQADEDISFIQSLQQSGNRIVSLRAKAILNHLGQAGDLDPTTPLPDDDITKFASNRALVSLASGSTPQYQTWLQDPAIENLLFQKVLKAEVDFSRDYESSWRRDEEPHTSAFLAKVESAFSDSDGILKSWRSQGNGLAPKIKFSYRQPGKGEEGKKDPSGNKLGADVAFILDIKDKGNIISKRAALVQCKKLYGQDDGYSFKPSFNIKIPQHQAIRSQTESSFYMFFKPNHIDPFVWVMPAQSVEVNLKLLKNSSTLNNQESFSRECPALC